MKTIIYIVLAIVGLRIIHKMQTRNVRPRVMKTNMKGMPGTRKAPSRGMVQRDQVTGKYIVGTPALPPIDIIVEGQRGANFLF